MGRSLVGFGPFEFLVNAIMRVSFGHDKSHGSAVAFGFC
jgi:hypothetical protein